MRRLRHLLRRRGHSRKTSAGVRKAEPIRFTELAREIPGKWLAIRGEEVVEVRDTLDQLMGALAERCINDVTVIRAAAEHETELVGIG
jgi:hypothetical protein